MRQSILYLVSYYLVYLEAALVVVFSVALAISAGLARWRQTRHRSRTERGRALLADAISGRGTTSEGAEAFARLPWTVQQELLHEFGESLSGGGRRHLAALGIAAGCARRAEAMCRSWWWWDRLAGARVLTALDVDRAVMRPLLRDPSGVVRAQAFVWAAGRDDGAVIDELVSRLSDPERLCRFTVQDSLLRLGRLSAPSLARFLADPSRPGIVDGLRVARGIAVPSLLAPVTALAAHADADVRAGVAAVLGAIGGEAAQATLVVLLDDHSADVRATAARSLGEQGAWTTSSALLRMLGDTAWPVRRECALALRRMGGVGHLTLRKALAGNNAFAADMARQVLDLPESVYQQATA
jgi:hypothetical protein